jgi:carbon storage regulator
MLVLSRKVGERILIGDNISVTVVRITGGGVRIGIEAPPDMTVIRQELREHVGDVGIQPGDVSPAASSVGAR